MSPESGGDARRVVRSFVRRTGRVTRAQARALERLWPRYGVDPDGVVDLDRLFGRRAPRAVEIGFGMGDALVDMARAHPERDYLGIEVHEAGVGRALALLEREGLGNVRLLRRDAVDVLGGNLDGRCLDEVLIFFPDPWPKKRHHKRRLIRPDFVDLLARRIAPGGRVHLATDWAPYAEQMLAVFEADGRFVNESGSGAFAADAGERPRTKFERRGERLGHRTFDLSFRRLP